MSVATTIWQPTDGTSESSTTGLTYIVDPLGVFIVDPLGVFIVDTGIESTPMAATVWLQDEGV